jgi:hypothetical protein
VQAFKCLRSRQTALSGRREAMSSHPPTEERVRLGSFCRRPLSEYGVYYATPLSFPSSVLNLNEIAFEPFPPSSSQYLCFLGALISSARGLSMRIALLLFRRPTWGESLAVTRRTATQVSAHRCNESMSFLSVLHAEESFLKR